MAQIDLERLIISVAQCERAKCKIYPQAADKVSLWFAISPNPLERLMPAVIAHLWGNFFLTEVFDFVTEVTVLLSCSKTLFEI